MNKPIKFWNHILAMYSTEELPKEWTPKSEHGDIRSYVRADDYDALAEENAKLKTMCKFINEQTDLAIELKKENEKLKSDLETERLRLAGCGVAALGNTAERVKQRIERDNPYWSASYGDVCRAVDAEIELRLCKQELLEALTGAQDTICGEYCGPPRHHPLCDEPKQALDKWGEK